VAEDRIDPSDQIPEADLLDQQTAIDPQQLTEIETEPVCQPVSESVFGVLDAPAGPVEEADRLEQQTSVPGGDEDDYPREP
jgi:hypothetical protein